MRSRGSTATATSREGSARTPGAHRPISSDENKFAPTMISSRNNSKHPVLARTPLSKRVFDVLLSGVGLVLALPVGAVARAGTKLGAGGSDFFFQERAGRG